MVRTYHICVSSHKEVLFRCKEDYFWMMNTLAVTAFKTHTIVIAFSFMSDHIHLVVITQDAAEFVRILRSSYAKYFNLKYGRRGQLGERHFFKIELKGLYHTLAAVNYVLRNAVHHGVTSTPFEYPYNSANCYFRKELGHLSAFDFPADSSYRVAKTSSSVISSSEISSASKASGAIAANEYFISSNDCSDNLYCGNGGCSNIICGIGRGVYFRKSKCYISKNTKLPKEYKTDCKGLIYRELYVDTLLVEKWYGTARGFLYNMNRLSSEEWTREQAKDNNGFKPVTVKEIEAGTGVNLSDILSNEKKLRNPRRIMDADVCVLIDSKILPRLGKKSYCFLDAGEKMKILEYLKRDYYLSDVQIKRCVGF